MRFIKYQPQIFNGNEFSKYDFHTYLGDNEYKKYDTYIGAEDDEVIFLFSMTAGETLVLPLGSFAIDVDWGDGVKTKHNSISPIDPSHAYSLTGDFTVKIKGICKSIDFIDNVSRNKLKEIIYIGNVGLTTLRFRGCSNLVKVVYPLNCPTLKDFYSTFGFCTSLTTLPSEMFANCPDITTFERTFENCYALQTLPNRLFGNCLKVTSFSRTFVSCLLLQSLPSDLFYNCPNVLHFWNTFASCSALLSVTGDIFYNCPDALSFYNTFGSCTSLQSMPNGMFDNCLKVTDFQSTFFNCVSMTGLAPPLWQRVKLDPDGIYRPNGSGCFSYCNSLANYEAIPSYWR